MALLRISLLNLALGMTLFWTLADTYPFSVIEEKSHIFAEKESRFDRSGGPDIWRTAKEDFDERLIATGSHEFVVAVIPQGRRTATVTAGIRVQARQSNLNNIINPPPPPPPPPDNHPKDASAQIAIPDSVCEASDTACIDQTRKEWVKSIADGGTLHVDDTTGGVTATAIAQEVGNSGGSSDSDEDLEWEDHKNEGPDAEWTGDPSE